MMDKIFTCIICIMLFSISIILTGNVFELWDTSSFISGWWSIYIFILGLLIVIAKRNKFSGIFLMVLSLSIGMYIYNLIMFRDIYYICGAVFFILIAIYLFLVMHKKRNKVVNKAARTFYASTLGEVAEKINGSVENFGINAFLGQVFLDLSDVKIKGEVVIDIQCTLGNVELILPKSVKVSTNHKSTLGSMHNFRVSPKKSSGNIIINSTCCLGEINIK